jgi:hypothetical protein
MGEKTCKHNEESNYDTRFMNIGMMFSIINEKWEQIRNTRTECIHQIKIDDPKILIDYSENGRNSLERGVHISMTEDNKYEVYGVVDKEEKFRTRVDTEEQACYKVLEIRGVKF